MKKVRLTSVCCLLRRSQVVYVHTDSFDISRINSPYGQMFKYVTDESLHINWLTRTDNSYTLMLR